MDSFELDSRKAMQALLAQQGLNQAQQHPFNQWFQGQAINRIQQGPSLNPFQQLLFNQLNQQGQRLNPFQQVLSDQQNQQGQSLNPFQQVPFNQLNQLGQAINPIQQVQFQPLIPFQQESFIPMIPLDPELLSRKLDIVRAEPINLLQALSIIYPNFEFLKQQLLASKYKKELETTLLDDMKDLTPGLDEFEINLGVTRLMICALFGYMAKGLKLISQGASVDKQNDEGFTALIFASTSQYEDCVKMLIDKGADVNIKDRGQMDALKWAVLQNNFEITKILLDHKAGVNAKTASGLNSLHIAVEKGFHKIVKMLLQNNVDIDSKSLDGWTPLMRSARLSDSNITKLLLEKKADVNQINYEGNTALHISVMYLNKSSISQLLKHAADVNCANSLGMTPLMYAVKFNSLKIVQKLLAKGASKTINAVNKFKQTALFYAVFNNKTDILEELIKAGAEANNKDISGLSPITYACKNKAHGIVKILVGFKDDVWYNSYEYILCLITSINIDDVQSTKYLLKGKEKILSEIVLLYSFGALCPLHTALTNGNIDMLEILLNAGADVNGTNTDFQTALMISILLEDTNTAKLLVNAYNADVNLKDSNGDTALILAAATNNKTIIDFLLSKNASREIINNHGVSAMMLASSFGNFDMVCSLYQEGYNLELHDSEGWTPLLYSALSEDAQIVKFLLDKGAKVNVFSKDRATPLIIASANGNAQVVSLFLEHGASVNERDGNGQTALIHAARKGHKEILEILLENELTNCSIGDNFKRTALGFTVATRNLECVKLLLKYINNCSQGDIKCNTPLMISASNGFIECMKLLLELHVEVNESNVDGNTALHFCSNNGHNEAVSLLLQKNADPNKININGNSPLMMASSKGYTLVVESLLSSPDVDVNLFNSVHGNSTLMIAVMFNNLTIVKQLVHSGADVNASNKSGKTALHFSVICGFVKVVNYLMTVPNINLNAETKEGHTPLIYSIHFGRFDLIKSLIEAGVEIKKFTKLKTSALFYSIQSKNVSALRIILQNCELSRKEKNTYLECAKISECTSEILELIEQAKPCEEVPKDTQTKNEANKSLVETECKPQGPACTSSFDDLSEVVTHFPDNTMEQAKLQIDTSSTKSLNIYFQGDNHKVTFNSNIVKNVNTEKIKNAQIGDNNVFNVQSGQM